LLIENVEETLDPILEPVLNKELKKEKSSQWKIKIGGEEIVYNQEFRLYITTKMPNPHYVPEIVIKITLINFTVTLAGLEDQLLIDVIKNERPELEEQRDNLIVQISDFNKQLVELQDKILRQIYDIQGDILDNENIIITLEASKSTSITINKGMKEASETAETINSIQRGVPTSGTERIHHLLRDRRPHVSRPYVPIFARVLYWTFQEKDGKLREKRRVSLKE
jgi:dynein heavy chain